MSFEDKLNKIVIFNDKPIDLKKLHPDLKDQLIKVYKTTKNTVRINWITNKGNYMKWKMN